MPTFSDFDVEAIIEWALAVIGSLGFFLPIVIFALANLFSRKNKAQPAEPRPPQRRATHSSPPPVQPIPSFPFGSASWTEPDIRPPAPASRRVPPPTRPNWGSTFDDNDAARADDTLKWGSAFDDNDAEKRGESLKWGSAFDGERERIKWGWDDAEWGAGFSKKKDSEPRITIG